MVDGVDALQIAGWLADVGYLADEHTCAAVQLAGQLAKPVLVEGPAGTGKTALAVSMAASTGRRLIRLQCYEGLDEAKALYEWNPPQAAAANLAGPGERAPRARHWTE